MSDSAPPSLPQTPRLTLAQYLERRGRCSPFEAVALVEDILDVLQVAHAAGRVHGALSLDCVQIDAGTLERLEITGWGGAGAAAPQKDLHDAARLLAVLATGRWPGADAAPGGDLDEPLRSVLLRGLSPGGFASAEAFREALRTWDVAEGAAVPGTRNATLEFLLRRMRHQSDFPALSDSVARIQRVAHSETDSISDLTHEILKDVALTHKLLRLVNSVHYAREGRGTISTVSRAVSLVGFNAVRNMALSLVLLDHMQDRSHAGRMREEFLRAMLAGSMAAELCSATHEAEEAFIGAMFQNLGRLLCEFYFAQEAQQIRDLVAGGRYAGGEQAAAEQVLGLSLEDLGAGVARAWGLPESLLRCIRTPLGSPPLRAPERGVERLRWAARAANESAAALLHGAPDQAEERLRLLAVQYARTLALPAEAIGAAMLSARQKLIALAEALELRVEPGSAAARLLRLPTGGNAPQAAEDVLASHELRAAVPAPLPAVVFSQSGSPSSPALVAQVLAAGVQDIANAMAESFQLNDVLRMILETMFRALGVRRMVFCLRDTRSDLVTGRFGLGEDCNAAVQALRVPLKAPGDLFAAVCLRGADTLISDATEARMQARLPDWYRQGINAASFLLLPLQIKGQPFALIYADHAQAGAIQVDDRALGLLRTLRNQAVMAFRQAG
jgi:HD-like signal output (HDOD) protein